jgi:hypothetical protein
LPVASSNRETTTILSLGRSFVSDKLRQLRNTGVSEAQSTGMDALGPPGNSIRQFFRSAGVLHMLQGKCLRSLWEITQVPFNISISSFDDGPLPETDDCEDDDREPPRYERITFPDHKYQALGSMVEKYYSVANAMISKTDFFILNAMAGILSESDNIKRPFRALQTVQSVREYSGLVTKLLITLMNLSIKSKEELSALDVILSPELQQKVYSFISSLLPLHPSSSFLVKSTRRLSSSMF